jgi:hypothetical protein
MKKNRGSLGYIEKLFFIMIAFTSHLLAQEYQWSVEVSKSELYVNEAFVVSYDCQFSKSDNEYNIEFTPPKQSSNYQLILLSKKESEEKGLRHDRFRYLIFPKQAGILALNFEALMRYTTKESIENSVIGRDNVEDIDFKDSVVKLPSISVSVLEQSQNIVGDLQLTYSVDSNKVKAYEPTHLTIMIKGFSNFQALQDFKIIIDGVKTFTQKASRNFIMTEKGFEGIFTQKFSLVGQKDFIIPQFELSYFNTSTKQVKSLSAGAIKVEVEKGFSKEKLLDEVSDDDSFHFNVSYLYYFLTFMSGLVIGFLLREFKFSKKIVSSFEAEVLGCKDEKALSVLLILEDNKKFASILERLEAKSITLSTAKKEALKL